LKVAPVHRTRAGSALPQPRAILARIMPGMFDGAATFTEATSNVGGAASCCAQTPSAASDSKAMSFINAFVNSKAYSVSGSLKVPMISFSSVHKQYGKQLLFVDASFQLNPGEKVGLVGPNGAGKTTLFRMIVGEELPDEGEVSVPKRLTIGYFRQDVEEMRGRSVLDEAIAGSGRLGELHHELEALHRAMEDPEQAGDMDRILERFGHVQEEYEHLGGYSLEAQAREVLHGLGFEDEQIDGDVGAVSGGWKMRVALARVLLGRPDVLLADEPTNHLDIESIIWLEKFLKSYEGALLMTSHDREFMNRVVTKIAEIDGGEITTYSGNYEFYERERAIREENQQAAFARQQAMFAKEQRFIERFKTHAAKAAQVQSRIKALDKIEKIELPRKRHIVKFEFRVPPRSGDQVAVIEDLNKHYGSRVLYDGFGLTIRRGERWAVMGKNGAGKTTLLKMIVGVTTPDSGSVRLGASLIMGYFAQQSMDVLDPDLSIMQQLQQDFPQDGIGALRTLAGAFQFSGDDVDKRIRALSGGEKSRLAMARLLYNPPNFLVLDEPTNHLDLATKEMLVEALHDFEGTMIFVSHDRTFLRGLSSRVLELGGESGRDRTPVVYPGSYIEYVAKMGHEAPGIYA
jgi:ATPase subunit of ABC transporter with duplicated ATPase domains